MPQRGAERRWRPSEGALGLPTQMAVIGAEGRAALCRGAGVSLSLPRRRQTQVPDGPPRVCLLTDLGGWVGASLLRQQAPGLSRTGGSREGASLGRFWHQEGLCLERTTY